MGPGESNRDVKSSMGVFEADGLPRLPFDDTRVGCAGGLGGGANGGGSFVGSGDDSIIFDNAWSCKLLCTSSLALGATSDRNSRSFDESVRELC
jgi:hypothetical protein